MPDSNEQKVFVISDSNEVTNSDKLFENDSIVLGINSGYESKYNFKDDYLQSEFEKEDKNNEGYGLFAKSITGGKPDRHAKLFFNVLNDRAGGIFLHNSKTGEITLKKDSSSENVSSNSKTSQTLAKIIDENCGQNARQRILYRVGKGLPNEDFDGFGNGKVDLEDLRILNSEMQATMIYHFTHERVNTNDYEKRKQEIMKEYVQDKLSITTEFYQIHHNACKAETKVLKEMIGSIVTREMRFELFTDEELFIKAFFNYGKVEYSLLVSRSNGRMSNFKKIIK